MHPPAPSELLARLRSLPAAQAILPLLEGEPSVFLVGGAVRDLLLGLRPRELDLVVDGDASALARRLGQPVRVHHRFGTATVSRDGFAFDVARARRERYPRPGALPEVEPAPLREDLQRRDFTVNAMALGLGGHHAGRLITVPDALEDLEHRRLRVLHTRSFEDDPTRLLRLARYAARLDFRAEPRTAALIDEAVAGGALGTVSGARIGGELRLLVREPDPVRAMAELERIGLAAAIEPGLRLPDPRLARTAMELLDGHGRADLLVLGMGLEAVSSGRRRALVDRLGFSAPERETIVAVSEEVTDLRRALAESERPSEIAVAVSGAAPEVVAAAGAQGAHEAARAWLSELRTVRLEIGGEDLVAAGVPPGPLVGYALRAALGAKLDGHATDRAAELREALRAAGR